MTIEAGLIQKQSYEKLLGSSFFKEVEAFSDDFLKGTGDLTEEYFKGMKPDYFHLWSRVYEYPFMYQEIARELSTGGPKRVLDAGSGLSFFPYLLTQKFSDVSVSCVDYDRGFVPLYPRVNARLKTQRVEFTPADMRQLPFPAETFDIIYCVSVLEHTSSYPQIVNEFSRVLKKGGILVLSFDVSLDGQKDIPISEAKELLKKLGTTFAPAYEVPTLNLVENQNYPDLVTTSWTKEKRPHLLPWKSPWKNAIKMALRFERPKFIFDLCCYCQVYRKPS